MTPDKLIIEFCGGELWIDLCVYPDATNWLIAALTQAQQILETREEVKPRIPAPSHKSPTISGKRDEI